MKIHTHLHTSIVICLNCQAQNKERQNCQAKNNINAPNAMPSATTMALRNTCSLLCLLYKLSPECLVSFRAVAP